jgi:uncharacterized protein YdaU (DUF1376 family)
MSKEHYLPLFVGDFMASTATWTGPERGLYLQLLAFQWASGPLPCDLERLARAVNYGVPEFQKLWPIMASKFNNGNGALTNPRLEAIRDKNAQIQLARAEAGRVGGLQRVANLKQNPSNRQPSVSDPKPILNPKTIKAGKPADPEWFIEFKSVYPPRSGDQNWRKALSHSNARISEGYATTEFIAGARRYAEFLKITGDIGTQYVKAAATFLGPGKPFLLPWTPPTPKESLFDEMTRLNSGAPHVRDTDESLPALAAPVRDVRR